jgi:transposase
MIVSGKGRSYERGKAVGIELRKSVIDMIVKEGGDITTGTFTGSFKNVAQHFSLSVSFVCKLWKQCCKTGDLTAQWKGGNNPPHLGPPEL